MKIREMNKTSVAISNIKINVLLIVFLATLCLAFLMNYFFITGPGGDSGSGLGGTGKFGESGLGGTGKFGDGGPGGSGGGVSNLSAVENEAEDNNDNFEAATLMISRINVRLEEPVVIVETLKLSPQNNLINPDIAVRDLMQQELTAIISEIENANNAAIYPELEPLVDNLELATHPVSLEFEDSIQTQIKEDFSLIVEDALVSSLEVTVQLMLVERNTQLTMLKPGSIVSIEVAGQVLPDRIRISIPVRPERPLRAAIATPRVTPVQRMMIPAPPVRPMRI